MRNMPLPRKRDYSINNIKNNRNKILFFAVFLFISTFVLYANSINNGFVFDDQGLILDNKYFHEGTTIGEILSSGYRQGNGTNDGLYRPVSMLSFVLNHTGGVLTPKPFHVTNVLFNSFNSVIFFLFIFILFNNLIIAFLSALFFSFHPVHTEAVANIAGRPEILYVFFLMLSWIVFEKIRNWVPALIFGSILFFLSLLSKETAIVFPFIYLIVKYISNDKINKRDIYIFIGLIFVILVYLLLRINILGDTVAGKKPEFYNNPLFYSAITERISTALAVFLQYLKILVFPVKFSSDYSYNSLKLYSSFLNYVPVISLSVIVLIISLSYYLRKKYSFLAFFSVIFFFPYLLVSNIFFPVGTIMGERFMYLPSAGFAVLCVSVLYRLFYNKKAVFYSVLIIILSYYSYKTIERNNDWKNDLILTEKDLSNYPENVKLLHNMGLFYSKQKMFEKSAECFNKSVEIYPGFSDGWSGLGKLFYDNGLLDESAKYYSNAVKISPEKDVLRFSYASVLINSGKFQQANDELQNALKINPDSPILYRAMGNLMIGMKRFDESITYFEHALSLGDDKTIIFNNIAAASYYSGKYEKALEFIKRAESEGVITNPDLVRSVMEKAK